MSTIKENGVFHGLMYTLFLNLSAQLTKELGMAPGGEFRRALAEVSLGVSGCHPSLNEGVIDGIRPRCHFSLTLNFGLRLMKS